MLTPFLLQLAATVLLGAWHAPQPPPRSLADVARMEAARRQALKSPGKQYTNADLSAYVAREQRVIAPSQGAGDLPAGEQRAARPAAVSAAQGVSVKEAMPPAEPVKGETWWRTRITEARARLERSRLFVDALQTRVNALTNDFYARDDPAQRSVIEQERNRALAEMERVKLEMVEQEKAIRDMEEEARQSGVPPGWLR
ncbi:MAG: hypothetical protein EHM24_31340 [Acidobacteria bacterium]|nr:MAG: hypothetical protein EHM24_31340 [Acidobacteriota bacterium]RPJ80941.1 MAG: hypothetical protein EHM13_11260 [Acidobacteriota bacterium]